MKRVLIISNYYKHKNSMASIRAIKLAKYLDRQGFDVSVLTSMQWDGWSYSMNTPEPSESIHEYYAPESVWIKRLYSLQGKIHRRGVSKLAQQSEKTSESTKVKVQKKSIKSEIRAFVSWSYYFLFDFLENYILYKSLVQQAKISKLCNFDCVIATYPGSGAHRAGVWMKKHRKCRSFIADFRDPAYNPGARNKKIEAYIDKRLQDATVKAADKIVCVSFGMADEIKHQYQDRKTAPVYVIHNGFDTEDYENIVLDNRHDEKVSFVYTGTLYHGRRTVEPLAKVLYELVCEGKIQKERICFKYAGPDYEVLREQLAKYSLEDTSESLGVVSRKESLTLQRNADAVLLLNWNDENYKGVIPGKIYEYMASRNPIIAIIMGNAKNSESAKMIREANLGVAFENADIQTEGALKEYVLTLFTKDKQENNTDISESIAMFDYKNIAKKYAGIIE